MTSFMVNFEQRVRLAQMLCKSGMIPQKTPEAALAVQLKGHELGVPAMAAAANIHFFDGKLSISADLLLAIASARYGVRAETVERTDERVRMVFTRPGWAPYEASFTIEEAKRANLMGKNNWKGYPKAMMAARCKTDGVRQICPEVGAGIYDPDELGAITDETGAVVEAETARGEVELFARRGGGEVAPEAEVVAPEDRLVRAGEREVRMGAMPTDYLEKSFIPWARSKGLDDLVVDAEAVLANRAFSAAVAADEIATETERNFPDASDEA